MFKENVKMGVLMKVEAVKVSLSKDELNALVIATEDWLESQTDVEVDSKEDEEFKCLMQDLYNCLGDLYSVTF